MRMVGQHPSQNVAIDPYLCWRSLHVRLGLTLSLCIRCYPQMVAGMGLWDTWCKLGSHFCNFCRERQGKEQVRSKRVPPSCEVVNDEEKARELFAEKSEAPAIIE